MEIFYDCLPCILRQSVELSEKVAVNTEQKNRIIKEALIILNNFDKYKCSPELTRDLHLAVKKFTGIDDLYKDFGFKPATTIEVGIKNFVDWYFDYFGVTI